MKLEDLGLALAIIGAVVWGIGMILMQIGFHRAS